MGLRVAGQGPARRHSCRRAGVPDMQWNRPAAVPSLLTIPRGSSPALTRVPLIRQTAINATMLPHVHILSPHFHVRNTASSIAQLVLRLTTGAIYNPLALLVEINPTRTSLGTYVFRLTDK